MRAYVLVSIFILILVACEPVQPTPISLTSTPKVSVSSGTQEKTATLTATAAATATGLSPTREAFTPSPPPSSPTQTPSPMPTAEFVEGVKLELFAQAGGTVGPYVAGEELVYAALGPYLVAIDFTTDPTSPQVVWQSEILKATVRALVADPYFLFALTTDGELLRYDISDPRQPVLASSAQVSKTAVDLAVDGDWGYLIDSACQGEQCHFSLQILYVGPPFDPKVWATIDLRGPVKAIQPAGPVVLVAYEYGLSIIGIGDDPEHPAEAAHYGTGYVSTAQLDLPYAYLAVEGRLEVLELSLVHPYEIKRVGEWKADPERDQVLGLSGMALGEKILYGFDTMGEMGYCSTSIFMIDISDAATPSLLARHENLPIFACANEGQVIGDRMYLQDWDGLHALELTDPIRPQLAGTFASPPEIGELVLYEEGDYLYWANDRAGASLHILDLRDPLEPKHYGPFAPGWALGSAISGRFLLAPAWVDGLHVLDLLNPIEPRIVASLSSEEVGEIVQVAVQGDYAYTAAQIFGLRVVDIHDPLNPSVVGEYRPSGSDIEQVDVNGIALSGSYAYFLEAEWEDERQSYRLRVLDVSDPAQPKALGALPFAEAACCNRHVAVSGEWAYIPTDAGVIVVDISNPQEPQRIGLIDLPEGAWDITLKGNLAIIAGGKAGVWVADLSDPHHPELVGHYDTPGLASRVALLGDTIYVADEHAGVLLLRIQ